MRSIGLLPCLRLRSSHLLLQTRLGSYHLLFHLLLQARPGSCRSLMLDPGTLISFDIHCHGKTLDSTPRAKRKQNETKSRHAQSPILAYPSVSNIPWFACSILSPLSLICSDRSGTNA
ncbi:hypothetical protein BC567DRAFT_229295 [Phyllosticta citribraziliensis]